MKKILFIYLLFTFWCYSQAGSFDTTFDTDGKATYCFVLGTTGNTIDGGFQSSGKIVQLYYDYNEVRMMILRF